MKRSAPVLLALLGGIILIAVAIRLLWAPGSSETTTPGTATSASGSIDPSEGFPAPETEDRAGSTAGAARVAEPAGPIPDASAATGEDVPTVSYRASGRVLDDATGEPVAGAWVRAYREPPPLTIFDLKNAINRDIGQFWDAGAEQSYRPDLESGRGRRAKASWKKQAFVETRSDGQGRFVLEGIPGSVFNLSAFEPMGLCLRPPHVRIREGVEVQGIELRLFAGGLVRGRVLLPDGRPAQQAKVTLGQAFDPFQAVGGKMTLRVPDATHSDADGRFVFAAVPGPATYMVTASLEPYGSPETSRVEVRVGSAAECELQLTTAGRCRIEVLDGASHPVAGAWIKIQPTRVQFDEMMMREGQMDGRHLQTDDRGEVLVEGLDPGPYRLRVTHPEFMQHTVKKVTITAEQTTDCQVVLQPGAQLTGRVLDTEDEPIPGARVRARQKPSLTDIFSFGEAYEIPWTDVDDAGRFTLRGLPDETLTVEAKADDYALASTDSRPGDLPVTLHLKSLAAIEGTVVSRVTGDVIKSFTIRVEKKQGFSLDFTKMGVDMIFDRPVPFHTDDGRFRMKGLEDGRYRLEVRAEGHAAKMSDWIDVTDGEGKRGLLFFLGPEGAIEGVVVDAADGSPVDGAQVYVKTGSSNPIAEMVGSIFHDLGPTTGADGRFRLGGLSTGTYRLAAKHPDYAGGLLDGIAVVEGQVTGDVTLEVDRGGEIYGTVYDDRGQPVAEARVFCNDAGSTRFRSGATDGDGNYSLTGLAQGSYVVTLFPGNLALGAEDFISEVTQGLQTQSVSLGAGERKRVDFHRGERKGSVVAGRVTQRGAGVAGAIVSVIAQGESMPGQGQSSAHTAITGQDGSFRLEGVAPGHAVLQAQKMVDPFGGMMGAQVREIIVQASGETRADVELPTAEIHGAVKDLATGQPISGVTVFGSLQGAEKERVGLLAFGKSYAAMGRSDAQGHFTLIDLAAGRYTLNAGGMDLFGLSSTGHAITRVENIEVKDGQILEIAPIRMAQAAEIEGIVKDTAGNPVGGVSIFLRRSGSDEDFLQRFTVVASDSSGSFSYQGVPEGHYDVLCRSSRFAAAAEHGVSAVAGETTHVTLKIDRGTAVFVVLEKVPVTELADLDLELTGPQGHIPLGLLGISDLAGVMFQFPEPGVYGLGTFAPGNYHLEGTFSGKSFERDFVLNGQPELRLMVDIE